MMESQEVHEMVEAILISNTLRVMKIIVKARQKFRTALMLIGIIRETLILATSSLNVAPLEK